MVMGAVVQDSIFFARIKAPCKNRISLRGLRTFGNISDSFCRLPWLAAYLWRWASTWI